MGKYIKKESLSKTIKRHIQWKEKYLGRICRSIWEFVNPKGEKYLFASFTTGKFPKDRDRIIVTLAYFDPRVRMFLPSR